MLWDLQEGQNKVQQIWPESGARRLMEQEELWKNTVEKNWEEKS